MRDSCGSSGTGETPQAFTPRRLTGRPAESEHLEGKSTTPHYLVIATKYAKTAKNKEQLYRKLIFSFIPSFFHQASLSDNMFQVVIWISYSKLDNADISQKRVIFTNNSQFSVYVISNIISI